MSGVIPNECREMLANKNFRDNRVPVARGLERFHGPLPRAAWRMQHLY